MSWFPWETSHTMPGQHNLSVNAVKYCLLPTGYFSLSHWLCKQLTQILLYSLFLYWSLCINFFTTLSILKRWLLAFRLSLTITRIIVTMISVRAVHQGSDTSAGLHQDMPAEGVGLTWENWQSLTLSQPGLKPMKSTFTGLDQVYTIVPVSYTHLTLPTRRTV